jgi:hypothetical protein
MPLLDDLIGAAEQRKRQADAQRLGGLEVDDQLHLCDLLTGRLASFSPLRIRPV